ncbi:MAG: hypothetical protein HRU20_22760 [Pseudomonadales bacterium]|nr:hypothetical protein [Pseudomonadales bacterium]
MSIASWQPDSEKQTLALTDDDLQNFIALGAEDDVEKSTQNISDDDLKTLQPLMSQPRKLWMTLADTLSIQDLHNLIRFFTLVEANNSSLEAGNDSPVIAFNKCLRKRGHALDKEFLLWIKQHSSNQFIPNGSVL